MKPLMISQAGAFILVKYPYRKGQDLYVCIKGFPVFCAQCEAQFPREDFMSHIRGHDRRKGKAEVWHYKDGNWYTVSHLSATPPEGGACDEIVCDCKEGGDA